jgi:hypothetical protein
LGEEFSALAPNPIFMFLTTIYALFSKLSIFFESLIFLYPRPPNPDTAPVISPLTPTGEECSTRPSLPSILLLAKIVHPPGERISSLPSLQLRSFRNRSIEIRF